MCSLALVSICMVLPIAFAETSDLETIKASGHPTYYGSVEDAHTAWENTSKGKVIFPDSFDRYKSGKTIITMSGYRDEKNAIIRGFEIYFMNCQPAVSIELDTALDIAKTYLPLDVLSEYYDFNDSYFLPEGNGKGGNYVVRYHLTDSASEGYYAKEHSYAGQMNIIFYVNDSGYVDYFTIGMQMPNGTTATVEAVEWQYDFMG